MLSGGIGGSEADAASRADRLLDGLEASRAGGEIRGTGPERRRMRAMTPEQACLYGCSAGAGIPPGPYSADRSQ